MRVILILIYTFAKMVFLVALAAWECSAAEPTLARLSFRLPPERMAEFEAVYRAKIAPLLKRHGLPESSRQGRATVDSVFSRLIEVKTPSWMVQTQEALDGDLSWSALLQDLGKRFGTADPDGLIRHRFDLYAVPAGPGKVVPAGRGKGHWHTYDVTDGFGGGILGTVLQDRQGYLWIATAGRGVSRYDGQTWTTFTIKDGLAGNGVSSILQDREGIFWFGTPPHGVTRYDGKTWTTLTTDDGLAHNRVWFGILQDREGALWFSTWGGGVSRYDGKTWTTFSAEAELQDNLVYSIVQDREDNLWFSTPHGVSRYDGKTWTPFTKENGLASDTVWAIFEDREGTLWFGTAGGLSRYDGKTWTTIDENEGLIGQVRSITQDREGGLWFRTSAGTLSRYDGQALTTFTSDDGLAGNQVWSILQDREGTLWFGTSDGVSRYDGQTWMTWDTDDGLAGNQVWSIFQDRDGNLWFNRVIYGGSSEKGVTRYDGEIFSTWTTDDGLADNRVSSILQDRDGNLWFGHISGGLSRYDGKIWTTFTTDDGLADNNVNAIFQDREGNFWFGTGNVNSPDGGVSRYDGKTWTTWTTENGLAENHVRSIVQDREGNLWFGTHGGVSRYDGKTFTTFTSDDGLADNYVMSILQDREGILWFGTRFGGVSRYDGRVFQNLTAKDGLAGNWVNTIFQDREGDLWFGTNGTGLTRFRPPPPSPPPVFIDAVVADRRYEGVSELALPSTGGLLAFEFRGISLKTRSKAMVYRYWLRGYEGDWQTTHARRVEYQDLPRGRYTFEVQAVDRDLVYSEAPATVVLTIHFPYTRIGLLSALGIAVVVIIWQSVRVFRRDRRLQEANAALSNGNNELFVLNKELQQKTEDLERERLVERIRGEVQSMERASDFEKVLSTLAEDLKTVGLNFDTCGIDVLNEPIDEPTMAYFETHGFHYTTYTIHPQGDVLQKSYDLTAPFPEVIEETLSRFIAGDPWLGTSSGTAILEVPIGQYGRLRLTASDRQAFTAEEIGAIQDFASAIALGYTRYLDFINLEAANREIREQTERKSAFLTSMSHELRTPMTAIKGYVDNLLDGIGGDLSERQQRTLTRVTQNSDHLLSLINNLLDLSKIEAGWMGVEVERFNVKDLIVSCCDTVNPLVKPNVKLDWDVSDDVGEATTDPGRLRQIVINLLSNAIKFTEQGAVGVRVSKVERADSESSLMIAVSDTGTGISGDALESIFEEFQQVKGSDPQHRGTGLGLPICKGFAELLGGSIQVESEVGKGSTFTLRIPMVYIES